MSALPIVVLCVLAAGAASAGVGTGRHNFTVTGPSKTLESVATSQEPTGLCVFCHTPHNAKPSRGLWNRSLPPVVYKLYESSTLEAKLKQPTGASRLCLSCHDGTLALGSLRKRPRQMRTVAGPLRGRVVLGTDLSDDHPISFVYDRSLAARKKDLLDPTTLPNAVKLDSAGELQCTTCHEPHEDKVGKFLVMDNHASRLCITCHRMPGWQGSTHATSRATAKGGANPWPHTGFNTVADNGCENCHRQHTAGHPEWLLIQPGDSEGCLSCHRGTVAGKDVSADFRKFSAHPVEATQGVHKAKEDPLSMPRHVVCQDCHDSHSIGATTDRRSLGMLGLVDGIDPSGSPEEVARAEYEVCYKCHGLREETHFLVLRQDNETNSRLQFSQANASFHPVETVGRNHQISGFEAGFTTTSILRCSDCHSSQQPARGQQRAGAPHGSVYEPILSAQYTLADPSSESFQNYALCYSCHNRTALLGDAQGFPHRLHVVDARASCAACHDAHGSRSNLALINFLIRGKDGNPVVTAAPSGRLQFQSSGSGRGQCFLTCHGTVHDPAEYPATTNTQSGLPTSGVPVLPGSGVPGPGPPRPGAPSPGVPGPGGPAGGVPAPVRRR